MSWVTVSVPIIVGIIFIQFDTHKEVSMVMVMKLLQVMNLLLIQRVSKSNPFKGTKTEKNANIKTKIYLSPIIFFLIFTSKPAFSNLLQMKDFCLQKAQSIYYKIICSVFNQFLCLSQYSHAYVGVYHLQLKSLQLESLNHFRDNSTF